MKKEKSLLRAYDIQFSGLKLGNHLFTYSLDNEFFEYYKYPEILGADIHAEVNLEKKSNMLVLDFTLQGKATSICDRCAEACEVKISLEDERVILKFGVADSEKNDEIITLDEGSHTFNIADLLYEFSVIALPMFKTHPEGACNPEVLKILEKLKVKNEEKTDPRWSALKNIKLE